MEVIRNQEFLLLSADEILKLLSCDDVNVPDEESIFHALLMWVKHDVQRCKDLSMLLAYIRLPLLPAQRRTKEAGAVATEPAQIPEHKSFEEHKCFINFGFASLPCSSRYHCCSPSWGSSHSISCRMAGLVATPGKAGPSGGDGSSCRPSGGDGSSSAPSGRDGSSSGPSGGLEDTRKLSIKDEQYLKIISLRNRKKTSIELTAELAEGTGVIVHQINSTKVTLEIRTQRMCCSKNTSVKKGEHD
ncbi:UNVERIFIED_CONTAM: hypothetical protein FKN15_016013 [Acipenser sinensis]